MSTVDHTTPDAIEPDAGLPTEAKIFFLFGTFAATIGVIYGVWTARSPDGLEYAGFVGLLFSAGFSLFFGTFLALKVRGVQRDVEELEEEHDEITLYLPETSVWPIGIGVGASLALAGFALGYWVAIPGIVLFAHSVLGFALQSRSRSKY